MKADEYRYLAKQALSMSGWPRSPELTTMAYVLKGKVPDVSGTSRTSLSAFHAHGVKYLIVGGYAVSFHGQPRATKDIDLFIKADRANAKAAYAALIVSWRAA